MIAEVAAPISQTKRVTMVAGPGGELGIHKLTGEILETVSRLPVTVEKMTGVDVSKVRKTSTTVFFFPFIERWKKKGEAKRNSTEREVSVETFSNDTQKRRSHFYDREEVFTAHDPLLWSEAVHDRLISKCFARLRLAAHCIWFSVSMLLQSFQVPHLNHHSSVNDVKQLDFDIG